jgi:hypothetical protein
MQQYAGIYLLQNYSTCFGCSSHPLSGVHKTVTAASGTGHITYQGNNLPPAWPIGHAGGRCSSHPLSGVPKTVTAATGTGHITYQGNNLPPAWPIGHAGGRLLP